MEKNRKDIKQFFTWMRNGIAFCTSWFLILELIYNYVYNIPTVSTESLIEMVLFVMGGVFLFSFFFTRLFIKKWSFLRRLTCFIFLFSIYECMFFYCVGFFSGSGTIAEWSCFIGIVLILYLSCIAIYQLYSKKKGRVYTLALQNYQQERSMENGK